MILILNFSQQMCIHSHVGRPGCRHFEGAKIPTFKVWKEENCKLCPGAKILKKTCKIQPPDLIEII